LRRAQRVPHDRNCAEANGRPARAVAQAPRDLKADGSSARVVERMLRWSDRQRLVVLPEIEGLERRVASR